MNKIMKSLMWCWVILIIVIIPACNNTQTAQLVTPNNVDRTSTPTTSVITFPSSTNPTEVGSVITPTLKIDANKIWSIESSSDEIIRAVYWPDSDKGIIYFALSNRYDYDQVEWYRFNIISGIEELDQRDKFIWFPSYTLYFRNLWQYQSPSGRYSIELVVTGKNELVAYFDIWLHDNEKGTHVRLFEYAHGSISVEWSQDETLMVFSWGYEGPQEIIIVDLIDVSVTRLSDLSTQSGYTDGFWTLSPDGRYLVVTSYEEIQIISLTEEKSIVFNESAISPTWSWDSTLLYYWEEDMRLENMQLNVFDLRTEEISTLITRKQLHQLGVPYYTSSYSISPDGNHLILWSATDIWLVKIT